MLHSSLLYCIGVTEYKSKWKEIESRMTADFPLHATIVERGLAAQQEKKNNPWILH